MENTFWDNILKNLRRVMSLNPYFNGKYFLRYNKVIMIIKHTVLILILMENTFWENYAKETRTGYN